MGDTARRGEAVRPRDHDCGAGRRPHGAHRAHAHAAIVGRGARGFVDARLPRRRRCATSPPPPASATRGSCATSRRRTSCSPPSSTLRARQRAESARSGWPPTTRGPRLRRVARRNDDGPRLHARCSRRSRARHPPRAIPRTRSCATGTRGSSRLVDRAIEDAIAHDIVAADRDPRGEAVRLAAALGRAAAARAVPARTRRHRRGTGDPRGDRCASRSAGASPEDCRPTVRPPAPVPSLPRFSPADADSPLGLPGRPRAAHADRRRTRRRCSPARGTATPASATSRSAVGVSKSTLLHHYPSKEELLSAVLAERDRGIQLARLDTPRRARRRRAARHPAGRRRERRDGARAHRGVRGALVRGRAGRASGARVLRRALPRASSTTSRRSSAGRAGRRRPRRRTAIPSSRRSGSSRCGTVCSTSGSTTRDARRMSLPDLRRRILERSCFRPRA